MDFFILWYLLSILNIYYGFFQGENNLSDSLLKRINDSGQVHVYYLYAFQL